ncbi:MAG: glycosyltransferase family 39 protein [Sedimentisphaerales bacterium]|nr:glycosyltransferase family 39 protein [Sedimentisphaerales bacterium]
MFDRVISKNYVRVAMGMYLCLVVVLIMCIYWIYDHPYGVGWDESGYINRAYMDAVFWAKQGPVDTVRLLMKSDRERPPAYRFLVLPFTILGDATPQITRLVSLGVFTCALVFTYLACRIMVNRWGAIYATALTGLAPVLLCSSMTFGTDTAFYFSCAGTIYFTFCILKKCSSRFYWIGLALALAIGGMAKSSFALVGGGAIFSLLWFACVRRYDTALLKTTVKAGIAALILIAPWWVVNYQYAWKYAKYSTGFSRHSLGPVGVATWLKISEQFMVCSVGTICTLLVLGFMIVFLKQRLRNKKQILNQVEKRALGVCLFMSLPLILAQVFSQNHNLRLSSPALIPLYVGLGILASKLPWDASKPLRRFFLACIYGQLFLFISPILTNSNFKYSPRYFGIPSSQLFTHREQWDWRKLQNYCDSEGLRQPSIAYLGNLNTLNPPQISYPWIKRRDDQVKIKWLWRIEDGCLDWSVVMSEVKKYDVVIVPSRLHESLQGKPRHSMVMDNVHNQEFLTHLQNDSSFAMGPLLTMGRNDPLPVYVFLRKNRSVEEPRL